MDEEFNKSRRTFMVRTGAVFSLAIATPALLSCGIPDSDRAGAVAAVFGLIGLRLNPYAGAVVTLLGAIGASRVADLLEDLGEEVIDRLTPDLNKMREPNEDSPGDGGFTDEFTQCGEVDDGRLTIGLANLQHETVCVLIECLTGSNVLLERHEIIGLAAVVQYELDRGGKWVDDRDLVPDYIWPRAEAVQNLDGTGSAWATNLGNMTIETEVGLTTITIVVDGADKQLSSVYKVVEVGHNEVQVSSTSRDPQTITFGETDSTPATMTRRA